MEKLIYEDDEIIVFHQDTKSSIALVTFNEMGFSSKSSSWGGSAAAAAGLSSFGFVSKRPNWFPKANTSNAIEKIRRQLNTYNKVVTFGHSQGGYGAIKYSKALNASAVISFCPQYSISPHDMGGQDKRFSTYFLGEDSHDPIREDDTLISSNIFVFYDPTDALDKKNFGFIKNSIRQAFGIKIFGTGHSTIRPFARSQTLEKLVKAALDNDLPLVWKLSREAKKNWPARRIYLARQVSNRNARLAIDLAEGNIKHLTREVAPILLQNLFLAGQYAYISKISESLSLNTSPSSWNMLISSLNASGSAHEAIKLCAAKCFIDTGKTLDINTLYYSVGAGDSALIENLTTFGEGWHKEESWGRWSSAMHSRVYLNISKSSFNTVKIPISVFQPAKQGLKVFLTSTSGRRQVEVSNGYIILAQNLGRVVVDFLVEPLLSPSMINKNHDARPLGVRFLNQDKWVFVDS